MERGAVLAVCSIDVEKIVVRKGSDEWEKGEEDEEDENEDGGGDLDVVVVVVGVRGENASLEISALRRLVSRPSPIGAAADGRRRKRWRAYRPLPRRPVTMADSASILDHRKVQSKRGPSLV